MVGLAFDAAILSLNVTPINPDCETCTYRVSTGISQALDFARQAGARVFVITTGGGAPPPDYVEATQRAIDAGMVIVIASGNGGGPNPNATALGLATQTQGGTFIIAGGMNTDRAIRPTSDKAGDGASYALVALAQNVRVMTREGTESIFTGTSFSAPIIAGAAALLADAFPNLTGRQIVEILFRSADDAGDPGVDPIYGNGILNLTRAFSPQGQLQLAGSGIRLPGSDAGWASAAMGDAGPGVRGAIALDAYARAYAVDLVQQLRRAPAARPLGAAVRTDLTTGFAGAGGALVSVTVRESRLGLAEQTLASGEPVRDDERTRAVSGYAMGRIGSRTALALGISESGRTLQQRLTEHGDAAFLAATDPLSGVGFYAGSPLSMGVRHDLDGTIFTMIGERGDVGGFVPRPGAVSGLRQNRYLLSSLTAARRFGPAELSLGATRLAEEASVLGGRLSLSPGGATSWFADVALRADLGRGWQAGARYRRGWTAMAGQSALVTGGRLATDAWSADIERRGLFGSGDRFALRIAQPLRVRDGGYLLNVPVSYSYADGRVGYATRLYSLAPSGREIVFEAAYVVPFLSGQLGANAFLRHQPGHIAAAGTDLGAAIRLSFGF